MTIIDTDIQHPRGITIDFSEDMLYWVDSKKDTIECAGFLGNNRRVVAYQSGTIFFGIAVFEVKQIVEQTKLFSFESNSYGRLYKLLWWVLNGVL